MDYKEISSLKMDDSSLDKEAIIRLSKNHFKDSQFPEWKKSIYTFLEYWFDDSDCVVVSTSGSTGLPKNIRIRKNHMINSALKTGQFLGLKKGAKALLCLPAGFIAGKMMVVRAMVLELELTTRVPQGNPLKDLDESFDFAAMVPMQVHEILADTSGIEKLNRIKNLIFGGSSISDDLRKQIKKLSNHSFLSYGMTETVSHIALEYLNGPKADGRLHMLPGVEVELDAKQRLIIHAPEIADAPVKTNDLAIIHNAHTFEITGRYDNLIISGGVNIIPELIEKKLEAIIEQRFVVSSLPDEKLGDKLVLVIGDLPWPKEDQDAFIRKAASLLSVFEKPKQLVFLSKLPLTANDKIDRAKLKHQIRDL